MAGIGPIITYSRLTQWYTLTIDNIPIVSGNVLDFMGTDLLGYKIIGRVGGKDPSSLIYTKLNERTSYPVPVQTVL